jgi:predicted PilT family ATPase
MGGKKVHTSDLPANNGTDTLVADNGELHTAATQFEPVGEPMNKKQLDELAFMEEEMVVTVSESSNENDENPITVGVNGIFKQFYRGHPTRAKRKFVNGLIVRIGRVTTPEYINRAGERARSIKQHNAHKFPFTVIEDKNKKGGAWLAQRMMDPV